MRIDCSNGSRALQGWLVKWTCVVSVAAVSLALPARVDGEPGVRVLRPGDDLLWSIQAGRELLDGRSQIQCHVDEEGTIDLGRLGKVKVVGLTISEAKLALETHVYGRAQPPSQPTDRVSELPSPPFVAAGFLPAGPSLCPEFNNQANSGLTTWSPEARMAEGRTPAARIPVTTPIAPAMTLADVKPAGIDRMISEQARVQRSAPQSNHGFQRQRSAKKEGVKPDAGQRADHSAPTVSAVSFSTIDQRIMQNGTSSYHPLGAMPVCQASYSGPDPFPSDVASSPSDSAPHSAKPETGSRPKSGWQRLCDTVNGIRSHRSSAADAP